MTGAVFGGVQAHSGDVVFDIGSGIGNLAFQMAAEVGATTFGVEIRADLHDVGADVGKRLYETMRARGCGVVRCDCFERV